MTKDKLNDDKVYICTYGFVAGLPQECSLKQARELGMETDFLAAIENGNYVARGSAVRTASSKPKTKRKRTSTKSDLTLSSPSGRGDDKEK
jgi:hypothetical protein